MNTFISSQFNYFPLLWMLHSRSILKINKIHHRDLSIVYRDNHSSFESLLEKFGSVTIHHRNSQLLAVEFFKALNNLSPSFMSELFEIKDMKYELRNGGNLRLNLSRTSTWYRQLKLLSREYLDTGLIRNKTMQIMQVF